MSKFKTTRPEETQTTTTTITGGSQITGSLYVSGTVYANAFQVDSTSEKTYIGPSD